MPIHRVTIEKHQPSVGEFWTNVYFVNVNDRPAAIPIMDALVAAERALYIGPTGIYITKGRIDDRNPATPEAFTTKVYNLAGQRTGTTGGQAPLWVTVRVDLSTGDTGRPSRKFLRGVLTEDDFNMVSLSGTVQSLVVGYIQAVVNAGIVDVDGQNITNGALFNAPQMRQLRRGAKKKVTP